MGPSQIAETTRPPTSTDLDDWLQAAIQAAGLAGSIIENAFGASHEVETKQDQSPVTAVDRAAEMAIRKLFAELTPDHAFHGEEFGASGQGRWRWLVDPLDGTKSFIRGNPVLSTQIALSDQSTIWLGVSSAPLFGELLSARRGGGAWERGKRLATSDVTTFGATALSFGNIQSLARSEAAWSEVGALIGKVWRHRGYGDFLHYHLLARGAIDLVIESDVDLLDIAALAVIVAEAGGCMTDLAGEPIGTGTRSVLAAATAELHALALAELRQCSAVVRL